MKIVCIGGGPAGLYFTILMKLQDQRHDITILERNAPGYTYGWGVTIWDHLMETLRRCDAESARMIRDSVKSWSGQVVEIQGRKALETGEYGGYSLSRQCLLDILTKRARELGVRIEYEREVSSLSDLPECDLIVASDGVNSRLRELAAVEFATDVHVERNKYLWLGTDKVFDSFTYAFVKTEPGWIWCYAYGVDSSSSTSTFIIGCPPEVWSGLGFGAMSVAETLSALEEVFKSQLDGHRLLGKFRDDAAAPWMNFRTVTNKNWHAGKIVLMGDAAHTTHFTIGSGTKLAMEDAVTLASKLREQGEIQGALRAYTKERQAALRLPQRDARVSAQWFENVSSYLELKPDQFSILLLKRWSFLLQYLPPRLYLWLLTATEENAVLRALRRQIWPRVRAFYRRSMAAS